jgi:ribosome-associated heat shock protein Hsp15
MDSPDSPARLDKWLWAARFFKTRSQAAEAVDGGKVDVNGERSKRSRMIRPGDRIRIRSGPFEHRITVQAVAQKRGSAALASELFVEEAESRAARERLAQQHRLAARLDGGGSRGRPSKKDRRDLERWKKR